MIRTLPSAFLLLAVLLSGGARAEEQISPLHDKVREKQELIEKLQRDILKVDRSLAVTRKLIVQSKAAPYLPDLFFRLAELYVERSRYLYVLQAEQVTAAPSGQGGSIIAPEVRLLKEKALQVYHRILTEFPDYKDNDKVRFYIAHEYRELGKFPEMLTTYEELIEKNPKSPLIDESLYILGDYYFDKGDLPKAESYYQKILDRPYTSTHDLSNYKMGWVRLNQHDFKEAFRYFEAAVRAPKQDTSDKVLNVRREALSELVYTYTEVKQAKDAIAYFEALAHDNETLVFLLEKLGNRYWIKQEWENGAPIYRRLLTIDYDGEKDPDRAERLYDSIRNSKGKVVPRLDDVRALVRVAARGRADFRATPEDRKNIAKDFEIYARDLATRLQVEAQKGSDKKLQGEAADAYASYLSLFRVEKQLPAMKKNYAEALFAAGRDVRAGREYENLAKITPANAPNREDLLYSAILAYHTALRSDQVLSPFETTYARSGIEQLGAFYVKNYPRNERAATVKFNVARAYYDEGNFKTAGELFAAFVAEYPTSKDVSVAAHLSLDAFHNLGDYDRLAAVAKAFVANPALPPTLVAEMRDIAARSRGEEIDELALRAGETTGDIATGLIEYANKAKGTQAAERALHTAFVTYRDKRDLVKMKEVAAKLIADYPKSTLAADCLLSLGKFLTDAADYEGAAQDYDDFARRFATEAPALDAQVTAATLRLLLGDTQRGLAGMTQALSMTPPRRHAEIGMKLAEAQLKAGQTGQAEQTANKLLSEDPANAAAAALLGKILIDSNRLADAQQRLTQSAQAVQKGSRGGTADNEAAGKVFFLLGEVLYRQFTAIPDSDLEKKIGMVDPLGQAYAGAAQLGAGEEAVGGLYRMGLVYKAIAEALTSAPEPAGLSGGQRAEYHAQLEKQIAPVRAQADEAFTTCLRKARDLEVISPFVAGCRSQTRVDPRVVAPTFATVPLDSAKAKDLLAKLLKDPNDQANLEALGNAYLAAGNAGRARLVFGRLLELAENNPRAQSNIGVSLLELGEPEKAAAAFRKAIELDPNDAKARTNLAAMYCRNGDVEGAKAQLSELKGAPAGASFDVDGGYARCL